MRQGCLLSSLIFLAIQPLDNMLTTKQELGQLKGLEFDRVGIQLAQQFYSDNTTVIIRVDPTNFDSCKETLILTLLAKYLV